MKSGEARRGGRVFKWSWEPLNRTLRKLLNSKQLQRKNSWKCDGDDGEEQELFAFDSSGYNCGPRRNKGGSVDGKVGLKSFSYNPVVTVLILTVAWMYLYWESLVGGDLRTVVHHLGYMAVTFFLGIACFLAAVYIAVFDPNIAGRLRATLLGVILTSLHLLFLLDHGGSLKHHGAYNMLMFVIFVVPALVIGALEYGLWRIVGTRALVSVHVPFFLFAVVRTNGALTEGAAVWDQGFFGMRMQPLNHSLCTPVNHGLTWVDIFPEGSQNFGAGTFTCGDLEQEANAVGFSVNFTIDGVLTASCNAGDGMSYTPLPSTVDWPKGDKLIEETYEGLLLRPFNKNVMDKVREAGEIRYEVQTPVILDEEIEAVIVRCGGVEKLVTRVRPKPRILDRIAQAADSSGQVNDEKLNVVFIFLDATSRRGFHRRLRKTVAALEEANNRDYTRLYQFFRYSVVEFCTEPNSRAMFQNTIESHNQTVPPVWDDFRNSGYVTLFTADTCQDLAAAYMNRHSPHNTSSFDHELVAPFCHSDFFAENANPFGNFKGPYSITARCLKGEQVHDHELRYLESFRNAYPGQPKFSLAWFLEGHEGTTEVLRNMDDGLVSYLTNLTEQDWNNTAVIIAADHGLHMGLNFGISQNGAVEHKNPFLAMMLPPWFVSRQNRHNALHVNQQRMVTALDIYKTLQAFRMGGLNSEERATWVDPAAKYRLLNHSIDLLHEEVPESRSCKDAGIVPEWCQCL
ncbi:hypothetical protein M758_UG190600 [Ceratodon purpureus]|nr:hypothetical protein M758_UG190600 [Ceratodon purpureus]